MPLSLTPALAAFVVLTIDPVATVAAAGLDDPLATDAARKMVLGKYVGYVSRAIDVFDWRAPYHTYAIQFTSPAVDTCNELSMPVAQRQLGQHASLRTTSPLPWASIQQPPCRHSAVRVRVRLANDDGATFLAKEDVVRHRRLVVSSRCVCTHSLSPEVDLYATPGLEDFAATENKYSAVVVAHVSYDLSEVDELPDPHGFFEEKRRLQELIAESMARKTGKSPISTTKPQPSQPTTKEIIIPEDKRGVVAAEAKDQPTLDSETFSSAWESLNLAEYSMQAKAWIFRAVASKAKGLTNFIVQMNEERLYYLGNLTWLERTAVQFV